MDLRQLEDCANKGSGVVDEAVEHSSCSIELIHLLEQAIFKGKMSKLSGPLHLRKMRDVVLKKTPKVVAMAA